MAIEKIKNRFFEWEATGFFKPRLTDIQTEKGKAINELIDKVNEIIEHINESKKPKENDL